MNCHELSSLWCCGLKKLKKMSKLPKVLYELSDSDDEQLNSENQQSRSSESVPRSGITLTSQRGSEGSRGNNNVPHSRIISQQQGGNIKSGGSRGSGITLTSQQQEQGGNSGGSRGNNSVPCSRIISQQQGGNSGSGGSRGSGITLTSQRGGASKPPSTNQNDGNQGVGSNETVQRVSTSIHQGRGEDSDSEVDSEDEIVQQMDELLIEDGSNGMQKGKTTINDVLNPSNLLIETDEHTYVLPKAELPGMLTRLFSLLEECNSSSSLFSHVDKLKEMYDMTGLFKQQEESRVADEFEENTQRFVHNFVDKFYDGRQVRVQSVPNDNSVVERRNVSRLLQEPITITAADEEEEDEEDYDKRLTNTSLKKKIHNHKTTGND